MGGAGTRTPAAGILAGRVYGPNCNKSAPYAAKLMKFYKISIAGAPVNVIFTGRYYYFMNDFYGIIAIAERVSGFADKVTTFNISTGNANCIGGRLSSRTICQRAEKFIKKLENEYIKQDIKFLTKLAELDRFALNISAVAPAA